MSSSPPGLEQTYQLEHELGRGGFGVVLAGRRRSDGLMVAVKLPAGPQDEEVRARTLREGALLAGVSHPNLVPLLGIHPDRHGRLALVYALVEGRPLDEVLAGAPRPGPALVARWVEDLAEALEALHRVGLVHRDVKPGNVMLRGDGSLCLLDYGLARAVVPGGTVTATGMVVGTPESMAPEQLTGERVGPEADVYALGCLAYRALSGRPPYQGTPGEVIGGHLAGSFRRLRSLRPDLPSGAAEAVDEALARLPRDRPGPRAFARRLGRGLARGTTESHPVPPRELATRVLAERQPAARSPSTRRGRRRRTPGPLLAAGLGGVAVAAGLLWGADGRRPPRTATAPEVSPAAAAEVHDRDPAPGVAETRLPRGLVPAMLAEIADASGWLVDEAGRVYRAEDPPPGVATRSFLDPDPLVGARRLAEFHSLRGFVAWLDGGGRPEVLPEEDRAGLQACDQRLRDAELPSLFETFLRLRPAPDQVYVIDPADFEGLTPPSGGGTTSRGWQAVATEELARGLRLQRRMEAQLREGPPEELAVVGTGPSLTLFAGTTLPEYLRHNLRRRQGRILARPWTAELVEATRGFLVAATRWVREAEDPGWATWVAFDYLGTVRAGMFSQLAGMDPAWLMGGEARSPAEWAVFGRILALQAWVHRETNLPREARRLAERSVAAFRRAEGIRTALSIGPHLLGGVFEQAIETALDDHVWEAIPDLTRRFQARRSELEIGKRGEFARALLEYWGARGDDAALAPDILQQLVRDLEGVRTDRGHPDVDELRRRLELSLSPRR